MSTYNLQRNIRCVCPEISGFHVNITIFAVIGF